MYLQDIILSKTETVRDNRITKIFRALLKLPEIVEQLESGQAKLARSAKFELCMRHYPPVEMIRDRVDVETSDTVWKCPDCQVEYPSEDYLRTKRKIIQSRN